MTFYLFFPIFLFLSRSHRSDCCWWLLTACCVVHIPRTEIFPQKYERIFPDWPFARYFSYTIDRWWWWLVAAIAIHIATVFDFPLCVIQLMSSNKQWDKLTVSQNGSTDFLFATFVHVTLLRGWMGQGNGKNVCMCRLTESQNRDTCSTQGEWESRANEQLIIKSSDMGT